MAIEDPNLVHPTTKAARRRNSSADLMRQLAKLDHLYAKADSVAKAARFKERRIERLLLDMPLPVRPH